MSDTLYIGIATSTGDGRSGGRARTNDGLLDVSLAIPEEMGGSGGATNPEQLFAAGWASCLHSSLKGVAVQEQTPINDSAVVAVVQMETTPEGGFSLSAALHIRLSGVEQAVGYGLALAAHAVCPYSNATRGNIPVTVDVVVT